jgi:hypothetical protein
MLWLFPMFNSMVSSAQAAAAQQATRAQAQARTIGQFPSEMASSEVILGALLAHRDGLPRHGARLLQDEGVAPTLFVLSEGAPDRDIPLGSSSLWDVFSAGPATRNAELSKAESSLPSDVTAHRIGDFVFTYHGVTPGDAERLWLFIGEVRQASPGAEAPQTAAWIAGLSSGSVEVITPQRFDSALRSQNRLRAVRGLPPLPHPRSVTHGKPASASAAAPAESPENSPTGTTPP